MYANEDFVEYHKDLWHEVNQISSQSWEGGYKSSMV